MSREILVVWAGRHQREGWDALCSDYRRRLARHVVVRDQPVKVAQRGDGRERQRAEASALKAALPEPCYPVALDSRGRAMSSEELAVWLPRQRQEWPHPVAFLIGSDLGLGAEVLETSRERLSLGPMTFGHELARLVLYEQLYRALCIERGIKYHRQPF